MLGDRYVQYGKNLQKKKQKKKKTKKTKKNFLRTKPLIVGGMLTKIGQNLFTY